MQAVREGDLHGDLTIYVHQLCFMFVKEKTKALDLLKINFDVTPLARYCVWSKKENKNTMCLF